MSTNTGTNLSLGRRKAGPMESFAASWLARPAIRWLAMLLLCAAYLQGGIDKALDFPSAIAEMNHFGLAPAAPLAAFVIVFELGASVAILVGVYRWLAALGLGAFTLFATFLANRFWDAAPPERFMLANSFFEHLGLVGGFVLVAWYDLGRDDSRRLSPVTDRQLDTL